MSSTIYIWDFLVAGHRNLATEDKTASHYPTSGIIWLPPIVRFGEQSSGDVPRDTNYTLQAPRLLLLLRVPR
jgi:hypothetical protein